MKTNSTVFRTYYYIIFQTNGTQIKAKEYVDPGKQTFLSRFNDAAASDMVQIPNEYRDIVIAKSDITTVIQGVEISDSIETTFEEWRTLYDSNPNKIGFDHYRMPFMKGSAKDGARKPFIFIDAKDQIAYKNWLDANKEKAR